MTSRRASEKGRTRCELGEERERERDEKRER